MPSPMIHLCIAKNCITLGSQVKDKPLFYLGVISPDAIHSRPGADRRAKNITHLMPPGMYWQDIGFDNSFKSINKFFKSNKSNVQADFLLGYGIHILTDMHWTLTIYKKIMDDYNNSTNPAEERAKAYYHDMDIHEYDIYRNCIIGSDIPQHLQNPPYADFLDLLTAQEIKQWNERTKNWFDAPENQHKFEGSPKYSSAFGIKEFMSSCAKLIVSNITHDNN